MDRAVEKNERFVIASRPPEFVDQIREDLESREMDPALRGG
jgi:hypothetical protein